jgi:hypothetical protein
MTKYVSAAVLMCSALVAVSTASAASLNCVAVCTDIFRLNGHIMQSCGDRQVVKSALKVSAQAESRREAHEALKAQCKTGYLVKEITWTKTYCIARHNYDYADGVRNLLASVTPVKSAADLNCIDSVSGGGSGGPRFDQEAPQIAR